MKTSRRSRYIISRNLRLIAQQSRKYWWRLPKRVRVSYELEDMIADAVMHVYRRSNKYDKARAAETTWVQHITENYCRNIVAHHLRKRFTNCETVTLTPELSKYLPLESTSEELRRAQSGVESMLATGSDALLELIQSIFCGTVRNTPVHAGQIVAVPASVIEEFRELARRCNVTRYDFELVWRMASE